MADVASPSVADPVSGVGLGLLLLLLLLLELEEDVEEWPVGGTADRVHRRGYVTGNVGRFCPWGSRIKDPGRTTDSPRRTRSWLRRAVTLPGFT